MPNSDARLPVGAVPFTEMLLFAASTCTSLLSVALTTTLQAVVGIDVDPQLSVCCDTQLP